MIEFFLHRELIRRNICKSQFAEMTGIRRDTITAIVNGDIRRIPVDALDKICYVLNCDLSDIMRFTDKEYIVAKRNGSQVFGPETLEQCKQYMKELDNANGLQIKHVAC